MKRSFLLVTSFFILGVDLSAQQSHTFTGGIDTAWVRQYRPGLFASEDVPDAIAIDKWGNLFVTGNRATIKYDSNGKVLWTNAFRGTDIDVNPDGEAFAIRGGTGDYLTVKFSSSGEIVWMKKYDGPTNKIDNPVSVVTDRNGNVVVTGGSDGDCATVKYSPNGDTSWVRRYNAPANGSDSPVVLAVDSSGNVYVLGTRIIFSASACQCLKQKLNYALAHIWGLVN